MSGSNEKPRADAIGSRKSTGGQSRMQFCAHSLNVLHRRIHVKGHSNIVPLCPIVLHTATEKRMTQRNQMKAGPPVIIYFRRTSWRKLGAGLQN